MVVFSVRTGGIWSASRKLKVQQALEQERALQEEFERQKKYNGPVGKNPWGPISKDWNKLNKGGVIDFAAELELFKGLRNRTRVPRGSFEERRGLGRLSYRLDKPLKKDWDAPDVQDDEVFERRVPIRSLKRARSSDLELSDLENDEEKWNKKLKRPRMTMVADEVESR